MALESAARGRLAPTALARILKSRPMFAILWLIVVMDVWQFGLQLHNSATLWDFSSYYLSATLLLEHRNPYLTDFNPLGRKLGLQVSDIDHASHAPTFLLCIEPLALMPERAAFYIWEAINAACLAAALAILLAGSGLEPGSLLVLLALSILYPPVEWHFLCGQSNLPVLLLLAMCLRLMERGRDEAAGLCLALAGLLRIFPLVLIGYLAVARRWRTLTWTFAWLAAGMLITSGMLGSRTFLSFANGLALVTDLHWLALWQNIGLRAAISRCFWLLAGSHPEPAIDLLRRIAVILAMAWLLVVTVLATLKLEQGKDPDGRAFGLWVVASVLISPTSWVHYMVLFLIPFAQIVTAHHAAASIRAQWAAVLSYLAIVLVRWFPWPAGPDLPAWSAIAIAIGCFGSAVAAYLAAYWFTVDARVAVEA